MLRFLVLSLLCDLSENVHRALSRTSVHARVTQLVRLPSSRALAAAPRPPPTPAQGSLQMQVTYFSGGWDVQSGLCRSSHRDDNLLVEGSDAVDVLVRHIRERKPVKDL